MRRIEVIRFGIIWLILLIASSAMAQEASQTCSDDVLRIVGKRLGVPDFRYERDDGVVVSAACKRWPHNGQTIFAIAYGFEVDTTYLVGLADAGSNNIVSIFRKKVGIDALTQFTSTSLHIDTGRYRLSDRVRAFGVRFSSAARGASCPDAWGGEELQLFVPEGSALKLMGSLMMYRQRSLEGCISVMDPGARWEDAFLTLSIGSMGPKGLADLEVRASISSDGTEEAAPATSHVEHVQLRFDGHRYRVVGAPPWWLWDGWMLGESQP